MRGRKIGEIRSSARGMYIRNIADITPDWSDICNTVDIPKLYAIPCSTIPIIRCWQKEEEVLNEAKINN